MQNHTDKQIVTYLIDRQLEEDFSDWLKQRPEKNKPSNAFTADKPPVVIALYGLGYRRAEAKIKEQFGAFMMQQDGGTDPERGVHIDVIVTGLYGVEKNDAGFDQAKHSMRHHLFTLWNGQNRREGNAGVGFIGDSFNSAAKFENDYFVYFIPARTTPDVNLSEIKQYESFMKLGQENEIERFIDVLFEKMPRDKFSEACDRFIFLHGQPELQEEFVDFLLEDEDSFAEIIPIFRDFDFRSTPQVSNPAEPLGLREEVLQDLLRLNKDSVPAKENLGDK